MILSRRTGFILYPALPIDAFSPALSPVVHRRCLTLFLCSFLSYFSPFGYIDNSRALSSLLSDLTLALSLTGVPSCFSLWNYPRYSPTPAFDILILLSHCLLSLRFAITTVAFRARLRLLSMVVPCCNASASIPWVGFIVSYNCSPLLSE
jgi:hypothetical protein